LLEARLKYASSCRAQPMPFQLPLPRDYLVAHLFFYFSHLPLTTCRIFLAIVRVGDSPPLSPLPLTVTAPSSVPCDSCQVQFSATVDTSTLDKLPAARVMTISIRCAASTQGDAAAAPAAVPALLTFAFPSPGHSNLNSRLRTLILPPPSPPAPLAVHLRLVTPPSPRPRTCVMPQTDFRCCLASQLLVRYDNLQTCMYVLCLHNLTRLSQPWLLSSGISRGWVKVSQINSISAQNKNKQPANQIISFLSTTANNATTFCKYA
jgi:hypothetical protein